MRVIKSNARRQSLWRTVLLTVVAIVIGGAGTVAALAGLKVIDPEKLAFWHEKERAIPADWVSIPVCARSIPAYTMVTRDFLMNPKTGQFVLVWKPPTLVPKGVITEISRIRGRVTAHEKLAPYYFYENDFLPEGTRPGIVGGTPEGKRAITLDASKLKGVHGLKEGDHVDMLASIPVDMPGAGHSNSGQFGTKVVSTPDVALLPKRSLVRPLVQDGVVVTPVTLRNMPISSSSLMQGTTTHTVPVQEIVLAVDPEEVAPLAEAMDLKYEITCVARSGRPASAASPSPTPRKSAGGGWQALAAFAKTVLSAPNAAAPDSSKGRVPFSSNDNRDSSQGYGAKTVKPTNGEAPAKDRAARGDTPGLDPMAQVRFMEVMIGTQRQFVMFSGLGNSPVVASQDDGSAKAASGGVPAGAGEESQQ